VLLCRVGLYIYIYSSNFPRKLIVIVLRVAQMNYFFYSKAFHLYTLLSVSFHTSKQSDIWDLSPLCEWRFHFSGMWCLMVLYVRTNVSLDFFTSIFRDVESWNFYEVSFTVYSGTPWRMFEMKIAYQISYNKLLEWKGLNSKTLLLCLQT